MRKSLAVQQLPRGSEFTRASEGPQNGGKMTGMDVLEFKDINGPDPMPKYGAIWPIGSMGGISPPASLGLSQQSRYPSLLFPFLDAIY